MQHGLAMQASVSSSYNQSLYFPVVATTDFLDEDCFFQISLSIDYIQDLVVSTDVHVHCM